jgi:L-lactate utilization protein LutB
MLTLERLAFLMESMVHRIDSSYFSHRVTYYDGGHFDVVDEGISVYYTDEDGNEANVWIDEIVRVDDDGIVHCKDNHGESVEVEIFERMGKSKVLF